MRVESYVETTLHGYRVRIALPMQLFGWLLVGDDLELREQICLRGVETWRDAIARWT